MDIPKKKYDSMVVRLSPQRIAKEALIIGGESRGLDLTKTREILLEELPDLLTSATIKAKEEVLREILALSENTEEVFTERKTRFIGMVRRQYVLDMMKQLGINLEEPSE